MSQRGPLQCLHSPVGSAVVTLPSLPGEPGVGLISTLRPRLPPPSDLQLINIAEE